MEPSDLNLAVHLSTACPIIVGEGAVSRLDGLWPGFATKAVLICDAHVFRLHGDSVLREIRGVTGDVLTLPFEPGEGSKDVSTVARIHESMFKARVDRNAVVVAFGGGVAMDLAGFAASTYMRGLALVNVPTTLLAMVDASIGGKTGVNNEFGKNLIGSFHWPMAVMADTSFLATLPAAELRCGLAEMVKAGVIADPGLLDEIEASGDNVPNPDTIRRAAGVKVDVVAEDPLECGRRRVLNFGHTAGHGIESGTSMQTRHGNAVAAGMVVEGRVAVGCAGFPAGDLERIESILDRLGLPTRPACAFDRALPSIGMDKKGRDGTIRMALPNAIGRMEEAGGRWVVDVSPDTVGSCWNG